MVRIKSLISISMQNVEVDDLVPDLFIGYGFGVEELSIVNANVRSIYPHAFVHVRGLKTIDLSNNELTHVYEDAFAEVRRSKSRRDTNF